MKTDLVTLLGTRTICHPSRFTALKMDWGSELQIDVMSYPWWGENPQDSEDRKITFHFGGICDAKIDLSDFRPDPHNEFLEYFEARPLDDLEWAQGSWRQIYCSQAIPDPLSIYADLHDFLASVNCPYGPAHYLNMGQSRDLSGFREICASAHFLVGEAPQYVSDVIVASLQKQGAKSETLESGSRSGSLIWVGLGESNFICQSAYAVFEE